MRRRDDLVRRIGSLNLIRALGSRGSLRLKRLSEINRNSFGEYERSGNGKIFPALREGGNPVVANYQIRQAHAQQGEWKSPCWHSWVRQEY
jgi:hypothetical protein